MTTRLALISAPVLLLGIAAMADSHLPKVAWELTEGIQAPESAYYDADTGFLFLSQIGKGGGKAKDGDGWITKLKPDGTVVKMKWFTGLNAPKGLRSADGVLWVADIDRLVGINIATGKQHAAHTIEGAKFLNDVAADPIGSVYVSDMADGKIYMRHEGEIKVFAEGAQLESPNGLLVDNHRLLIAGWGRGIDESFGVKIPGRLLSFEFASKKITAITPKPTGNLDGVELDGRGGYVVTDWVAGKVFHISAKGETKTILTLPKGTADHAYLPAKELLILPQMLENKVTAYSLAGIVK